MPSCLSELCSFYERMVSNPASGMPPEGMTAELISFSLVLSKEGELVSVDDLRDSSGKPARRFVPAVKRRTSGIVPNYLWDNTGYVLGVDGKGKPARSARTAAAFRDLHKKMLAECEDVHAKALLSFLGIWKPEQFQKLELREALLDSNLVFRLEGEECFLHEVPTLKKIWLDSLNATGDSVEKGICLVSGQSGAIELTHPAVKGVVGAQSSGASLVSFNCPSFESFSKEQCANAPVSKHAAHAYTAALNYLLQPDHRQMVRIGDTSVVFWAERATPAEPLFGDFFDVVPSTGQSDQDKNQLARLKGILIGLRKGLPLNEADKDLEAGARFYVLGLAPNAGRLSIRFWLSNTLDVLLKNISRWYDDLSIERQSRDEEPDYPPLWRILLHTVAVQEKKETIPPELGGQLARTMLTGSPLPENMYTSVLQRIHADKQVGYDRAAIIKAYLHRNKGEKQNMTSLLNTDDQSIGYRLGRLFALLEHAQKDASEKKVNAPLRERYIGSASATPRLVFPMLLRLVQHHVTKAGKRHARYETWFSKRMDDIVGGLNEFPPVLPLDEQGNFMLGYYHQTNDFFRKKTNSDETGE